MDAARGLSIVLTKSAALPTAIPWHENSKARSKSYRQKKSAPLMNDFHLSKSAKPAKSRKPIAPDDLTIVSSIAPHWAKISHIISDNISLKLKRVSLLTSDEVIII